MAQFLVRPENRNGHRFRVEGDEARHLARVLRAQVGDIVTVFDGQGGRFRARIAAIDSTVPAVDGEILAELPLPKARTRFRLFQGLPKGPKFDYVIEKAVELGAVEITPFLSSKSPIRVDEDGGNAKQARWARIAEAAAKQCERPDLPSVTAPLSFDALIKSLAGAPSFLLSTSLAAQPLAAWFDGRAPEGSFFNGDSVIMGVIVGPESGFTAAEEAALVAAGAQPVRLGNNVLRTETAGLAALAILDFELNQRNTQS